MKESQSAVIKTGGNNNLDKQMTAQSILDGENSSGLWSKLNKEQMVQLRASEKFDMSYNLGLQGNLRSLSTSMLATPKLLNKLNYPNQPRLMSANSFIRTKEGFQFVDLNPKLEFLDQLGLSHIRIKEPDEREYMCIEARIPMNSSIKYISRIFSSEAEHLINLPLIQMNIQSLDEIKPRINLARNKKILNILNVVQFDVIISQGKGNEATQTMEGYAVVKFGLDNIEFECQGTLDSQIEFLEFNIKDHQPWRNPFGIQNVSIIDLKLQVTLENPPRLDIDGTIQIGQSKILISPCELIMDEFNPRHALITFIAQEFTLFQLFSSFKVQGLKGAVEQIFKASAVSKATFNITPISGVKIQGLNFPGGLEADLDYKFVGQDAQGRLKVHQANLILDSHLKTRLVIPEVLEFFNKDVLFDGPRISMKLQPATEVRKDGQLESYASPLPDIRLEGKAMIYDLNKTQFDAVAYLEEGGITMGSMGVIPDKVQALRSNLQIFLGDFTDSQPFQLFGTVVQEFERVVKPTAEKLKYLAEKGVQPFRVQKFELQRKYKLLEDKKKQYEKMMIVQNHQMEGFGRKQTMDSVNQKIMLKDTREREQQRILEELKQIQLKMAEIHSQMKSKIVFDHDTMLKEEKIKLDDGKEKSERELNKFVVDINKNLDQSESQLMKLKNMIRDRQDAPWFDTQKKAELAEIYPEFVNSRAETMDYKEGALQRLYYARLLHTDTCQTLEKEYNKKLKEEQEKLAQKMYEIDVQYKNDLIMVEQEAQLNIDKIFDQFHDDQQRIKEDSQDEQKYYEILRKEQIQKQKEEVRLFEEQLKKEESKAEIVYRQCQIPIKIIEGWQQLNIKQISMETILGGKQGFIFSVFLTFLGLNQTQFMRDQQQTVVGRQEEEFQLKFEKFPSLDQFSDNLSHSIYDQLFHESSQLFETDPNNQLDVQK